MKFICGACKTKYTISDDKVRGKVLKVKCKKCEAVVEVREAAAGAEAVARVVATGARDSAPGHPTLADPPRPRSVPTPGATLPGPAGSAPPRPRMGASTLGAGAGGARAHAGSGPPPPPPDALKPGAAGARVATPGARAAVKPPSATGLPAARVPAAAARSAGAFAGSGSNGGSAGGLAGSLAEALSSSMSPAPTGASETVPARASYVDGLASRAAPKEWWAAIKDTPTGPMTREEINEHVRRGEVDAESLVWREGQDDWRPLREVHALSDLLRGKGGGVLGATARMPLQVPTPGADRAVGSVATPIPAVKAPVAAPAMALSAPAASRISTTDGMFPRSSIIPGLQPGSGSLQIPIEDIPDLTPSRSISSTLPIEEFPRGLVHADSILPAAPGKKMSPVVWVAICGALAFGVTLALGLLQYLGPRIGTQPTDTAERVRVVTVGGAVPDLAPELPGERATPTPAAPTEGGATSPRPTGGGSRAAAGTATPAPAKGTKVLSDADQALLARFQQQNGMPAGGNLDPNQLHRAGAGTSGPAASALTADQVRAVVGRERGSVQSCYERAMRGRSQAEDVRVTVVATVGASGAVMNVAVRGGNDPTMTQCIQGAVRRWRFPAAAGSSQPEIPFLFTAHAAR